MENVLDYGLKVVIYKTFPLLRQMTFKRITSWLLSDCIDDHGGD